MRIQGKHGPLKGSQSLPYAAALTRHLEARIAAEGGDGPITRQFVASEAERITTPDELRDPIGDDPFTPLAGITHRYPDRVLLKPTLTCAAYCRFCFRRAVVGQGDGMLGADALDAAYRYIADHPAIWEVILTGGDPLTLSDRRLAAIRERLDAIAHVAAIRVHTRAPVADPARITDGLVAALKGPKPVHVVIHCNHADELDDAVRAGLARMADAGLPLAAQSVLLRGVNDSAPALEALFRALLANRVRPYYLHHPDLAPGTGHFRLTVAEGRELMRALRGRLPGLALPSYVLDIPGGHGKVPVGPDYLDTAAGTVTDPWGATHPCPPGAIASESPSC